MKILVAIDFTDPYEKVLEQAVALANAFSARILLLHVTTPEQAADFLTYEPDPLIGGFQIDPQDMRDTVAERYQHEHKQLQEISRQLQDQGIESLALLVQGEDGEQILEEAQQHGADIIVLGTHGKGVASKLLLGSTSEFVIRHSRLPVYLVPTWE
jgi:nucleotide-binding universal stress UspA family protein